MSFKMRDMASRREFIMLEVPKEAPIRYPVRFVVRRILIVLAENKMKEFLDKYGNEIAIGIKWVLMCIGAVLVVFAASYHQVNRLNAEKQAVVEVNK